MVTIRSNANSFNHVCLPMPRLSKWPIALGICFTLLFFNQFKRDSSYEMITHGKTTTKIDATLPKPDGKNDYNLIKETTTSFHSFSFYVMGDTPYRDWQAKRLELQMSEMKSYVRKHPDRNISFAVHVGDIQKVANTNCSELAYETTSTLLRKGPVPTLVVPGDNDWYDCPNRTESFDFFLKYFGSFEKKWHKKDYKALGIERSEENRELFVFTKEGILFIGLHLLNAPIEHEDLDSWDARMKMNKEWVAQNIELHFRKAEIRGVVMLGHCLRSPRTRPFFLSVADYFVNITHREKIPVLYLHGDGHKWDVDTKLSHQLHWKHFRDIQVDQGGLADPIIVDIAPQIRGKLKGLKARNDLEHVFGKGLFRIDRQRGRYEHPKVMNDPAHIR